LKRRNEKMSNKDDPIVTSAIHIDPFEGYSSNREAIITPQKEPRRFIGSNFTFVPSSRIDVQLKELQRTNLVPTVIKEIEDFGFSL
jgi:hypothetical protein